MTASFAPPLGPRPRSFATHVLPALSYAALLFYSGLIRLGELPEVGVVPTDKLLHTLAFGGLALLLARAADWFWPAFSFAKKLVYGALGSSVAGLALELCQALTPYRSADVWDWIADSLGAALASGGFYALWRWVLRRTDG